MLKVLETIAGVLLMASDGVAHVWRWLPAWVRGLLAGAWCVGTLGVMIGLPIGGTTYWSTSHVTVLCDNAPPAVMEEMLAGQEFGRIICVRETPFGDGLVNLRYSVQTKDACAIYQFADNGYCTVVGPAEDRQ